MKKLFRYVLMALLSFAGVQASAQVFNISTGISNVNSTLLPVGSLDDTWTVALPGANINLPGSFQTTSCGLNNYGGASPNVRWLYPTGFSSNSCPMGNYYFKTTIELDCENITGAQFNFAHIGADDQIQEIIVNGNSHPVAWGFANWGVNVTLPLSSGELTAGTNTILVRVYNWGPGPGTSTPLGLEIEGNLTVTTGGPDASFTMTNNGSSVTASSSATGTHTWVVSGSPTGNPGSYTYIGTYNGPVLNLPAADRCYLIQHTVTNECGTSCSAQSVCNLDCTSPCGVTPPTNLQLTYEGMVWPPAPNGPYKFTWDPVPGAVSYEIEIYWNDPECCRKAADGYITLISVTDPAHLMDIHSSCFSWRVRAICEDGSSAVSDKKCANLSSDGGDPQGKMAPGGSVDGNTSITIFPNPAEASVSFNIESSAEVGFTVVVTDVNGKIVKTFDQTGTAQKHTSLKWNTSSLSKGIYIVKITTSDSQVITEKLIIK